MQTKPSREKEARMDSTLRKMFNYQQFENNPRLKKMLGDALSRYNFSDEGEISDDDVGLLNAAGSQVADPKRDKEKRS